MAASGAHGVMIGRAAMGRPWLVGAVAAALDGEAYKLPGRWEQLDSLVAQIEDSMSLYGSALGIRIVRKHISAAIDHLDTDWSAAERRETRAMACQIDAPDRLISALNDIYLDQRSLVA